MGRNRELKGKRLLLLGSSVWKDEIRHIADVHGITLIVTGNIPAPLDDIADEVYRVDSTDHEAMKRFITTHDIDGVFMGGSELIISHASQYLNELGYPCYCTKKQWDTLSDKSSFKALCQQFGLPVAKAYTLDDLISFPVVTKPVDGCGGEGVSVCHDIKELQEGYAMAKAASREEKVIIEQFVPNDSIYAYYTFSEGKATFTTMATKYSARYANPEAYVACLHLFESSHKDEFRRLFEDKLLAMFRHLDIREGSLWIEVFFREGQYYFNESGFRYAGQVSIYPVEYITGINQLAVDITFALTGTSANSTPSLFTTPPPRKKHYCMYYMQLQLGRIATINGVEELRQLPACVCLIINKNVGDEISGTRNLTQTLGAVHLVFDTINELHQTINKVHDILHVTDTQGQEMLIDMTDWENRNIVI